LSPSHHTCPLFKYITAITPATLGPPILFPSQFPSNSDGGPLRLPQFCSCLDCSHAIPPSLSTRHTNIPPYLLSISFLPCPHLSYSFPLPDPHSVSPRPPPRYSHAPATPLPHHLPASTPHSGPSLPPSHPDPTPINYGKSPPPVHPPPSHPQQSFPHLNKPSLLVRS